MKPYERLQAETEREFELFEAYRRLPVYRRTVANLAEILGSEAPGHAYLVRIMAENDWEKRAQAYDEDARIVREAQDKEERRVMKERHRKVARVLQDKGIAALETLDPHMIGPTEARQFIESGQKLERQSYDEPDQITEQRQTLSQEDKRAFFDELAGALGAIYRPKDL